MTARELCRHTYLGARRVVLSPIAGIRVRAPLPKTIRKIFLVRVDRIGDLVLSTPFLRNLRESFPAAEVVLLGRHFTQELLHGGRLVDRILPIDEFQAGARRNLASEKYDLSVDLHCDYPLATAFLTRRAQARCSAGFDIGGRGVLFDIPVPALERKHFIEETLDILRALGLSPYSHSPQISIDPKAEQAALDILFEKGVYGKYAVFHPGGFYPEQRWPAERFAQLADLTAALGLTPVLIGGPADAACLATITEEMTTRTIRISGEGIGVCAAAIGRSALFVGNNSGPLHIACAMNIPSVSTMGPTDPVRFWPVSDLARVVRKEAVEDISVAEMFTAIRDTLP